MSAPAPAPNTPEWLAARQQGIGASEIAAVCGLSPWESPFSLYWRKVEGWAFPQSPKMEWGHRLEPVVAAKFADEHPDWFVGDTQFVVGPEPWMLATPDRFVGRLCNCDDPDDPVDNFGHKRCRICDGWGRAPKSAVLELKTGFPGEEWGPSGTAQIPVHYRCQVQWQMLCTGLHTAHVAVLLGGSDYREYEIRRDQRDIDTMVEMGRRFMHRLEVRDPPSIDDHIATVAALKRLHPDTDGSTVVVPEQLAAGWLRAVRWTRLAAQTKDRYEAELREFMGQAGRAVREDASFVASRSVFDVAAKTIDRRAYTTDRINAPRHVDGSGKLTK